MNTKTKIGMVILAIITIISIFIAVYMPFASKVQNLDFSIFDANNNYHYEVNEVLQFYVNDTVAIEGKKLVWHFGNGDTLMRKANVQYQYKTPGKYLVTLNVGKKVTINKYLNIISVPEVKTIDSIPRIHAISEAYQGEELIFSAEGPGVDTWFWEFGESGTVDAYEQQVVYVYENPGSYLVSLHTNTTQYPIYHRINILPRFEKIEEVVVVDSISLAADDIKKHLQAIADAQVQDKNIFYKNVNYIKQKYLCGNVDKVAVIINGDKYNDFYSYCQGLHFLENNNTKATKIDKVKIESIECIENIYVTQSTIKK